MKSILTTLALASIMAVGAIFTAESSHAAPAPAPVVAPAPIAAPAPAPAAAPAAAAQTLTECFQACQAQLTANLRACKPACWVCTTWVLWTCWSGHYDQQCLNICHNGANAVNTACRAACIQAHDADVLN